ncbi:hypothetical protein BC830DRAFT_1170979 [Chytriomyces sp. MP71]|nr:hypothetical protein BC830DRAFT_1170979 [Chytriomyces sp. MP71]
MLLFVSQLAILSQALPLSFKKAALDTSSSNVLLTYNGGALLSRVEVTIIYYGSSTQDKAALLGYYTSLLASDYMSVFSEYSTGSYTFGNGSVKGTYTEKGQLLTTLDDINDIQPYLRGLVQAGVITPTDNSYFPIHFTAKATITQGGGASCDVFGGYHSNVDVSDISNVQNLYYGVIPYCRTAALDMADAISHELGEAITDPVPGNGWYYLPTSSSSSTPEGEIGDICVGIMDTVADPQNSGNTLSVQKMWSNQQQSCATTGSGGAAPAPDTGGNSSNPNEVYFDSSYASTIGAVEITPIYYGGSKVKLQKYITSFYQYLVTSPYITALQEYSVSGVQDIEFGSVKKAYSDSKTKSKLSQETTLPNYLRGLVKSKTIKPTANSLFAIHLAPGITITSGGAKTCTDFCSLYGNIDISDIYSKTDTLYYTVIPDQSGKCAGLCAISGNVQHDTTTYATAMLVDVITNAWATQSSILVGDICSGQQAALSGWTVQQFWSNSAESCVGGN